MNRAEAFTNVHNRYADMSGVFYMSLVSQYLYDIYKIQLRRVVVYMDYRSGTRFPF